MSQTSEPHSPPHPRYGHKRASDRFIPWYVVAFFLTFMTVDAFFVYKAISTHSGVVTQQSYQKGLDYNQTIAADNQQKQLGWQAAIHAGQGTLNVVLRDAQSKPMTGARVTAYLSRAANARDDFTVDLREQGGGLYHQTVNFPLPGQWDIRIAVTWNNQPFQQRQRVVIR